MEAAEMEYKAFSTTSVSNSSGIFHDIRNAASIGNTSSENVDIYMDKVMQHLDLYVRIIFVSIINAFALTTNIINVMVLIKQGVRSCVSLCLFCISATDFVSTLTGFMTVPAKILTYLNLRPGFSPFALFFMGAFTSGVFYDVSNTLTSFLSLERCLCVCLPLKFKDIFTMKRTVAIIFGTYVLCFGLMLPHFLSSGLEWRTTGNSTYLALWVSPERAAVDTYIDVMHFCQITAIMCVIFLCTFIMLVTLKRSSKFQEGYAKGNNSVSTFEEKSKESSNTRVLNTPVESQESKIEAMNKADNLQQEKNDVIISYTQKSFIDEQTEVSKVKDTNFKQNKTSSKPKFEKENKRRKKDQTSQSSRNVNVMKTVITLCVICFICNLSRVMFATISHLEPKFRFGKEYDAWFQFSLALLYFIQLLNCSLNIFVYYRYNRSFRAALKQVFCRKLNT